MIQEFRIYKEIASIPTPYVPNAVYVVRAGVGIDIYVANSTGTQVHKHNNTGDVVGAASSVINTLPRFSDTTGKLLKTSSITVLDNGNLSTSGEITALKFIGDGSLLTNIPSSALPSNIAYKDELNIFTQNQDIQSRGLIIGKTDNTGGGLIDFRRTNDGAIGGSIGYINNSDFTTFGVNYTGGGSGFRIYSVGALRATFADTLFSLNTDLSIGANSILSDAFTDGVQDIGLRGTSGRLSYINKAVQGSEPWNYGIGLRTSDIGKPIFFSSGNLDWQLKIDHVKVSSKVPIYVNSIQGETYPTESFLRLDDDQTENTNMVSLGSIGIINYLSDTHNNNTGNLHRWYKGSGDTDLASLLMSLTDTGNLYLPNTLSVGTLNPETYKIRVNGTASFGDNTQNSQIIRLQAQTYAEMQFSTSSNFYLIGTGAGGGFSIKNGANNGSVLSFSVDSTGGRLSTVGNNIGLLNNAVGNVGIGWTNLFTVPSRLTIIGSGTTSSTRALDVQNSTFGSLFIVRDDGNIGVGTSTPNKKLEVSGDLRLTKNSGTRDIEFYNSNDTSGMAGPAVLSRIGSGNEVNQGSGFFTISTSLNGTLSERLRIDRNGYLGLGTTAPTELLEVYGNNPIIRLRQNPGIPGNPQLYISSAGTDNTSSIRLQNSYISSGTPNPGVFQFGSTTTDKVFVIDTVNKKVGVNTLTPTSTFQINGLLEDDPSLLGIRDFLGRTLFSVRDSNDAGIITAGYLGLTGARVVIDGGQYSTATSVSIFNHTDTTAKIFLPANGNGYFRSGNFGFGTTSPSQTVHVIGNILGDKIYAGNSILSSGSSASLQVNGFMRTGNIYLHSGGNVPNTTRDSDFLSNPDGDLYWTGLSSGKIYHSGNDGSGSGLDSDLLDGKEGIRYSNRLSLTGQVQLSDYRKSVIALCALNNTNASLHSYSHGTLYFKRFNGSFSSVKIQFTVDKKYNSEEFYYTSTSTGSIGYRFIKFEHNSELYGGIEVYFSDSYFGECIFNGDTNFDIFGLDYYNTQTSTVLNTEINTSITETGAILGSPVLYYNKEELATQSWTNSRGFLTSSTGVQTLSFSSGILNISLATSPINLDSRYLRKDTNQEFVGQLTVDNKLKISSSYSWTNSAVQTTSIEIINSNVIDATSASTFFMHNYGDGGVKFRMGPMGDKTLYLSSGASNGANSHTDDNNGTYFNALKINNNIVYHSGNLTTSVINDLNVDAETLRGTTLEELALESEINALFNVGNINPLSIYETARDS